MKELIFKGVYFALMLNGLYVYHSLSRGEVVTNGLRFIELSIEADLSIL